MTIDEVIQELWWIRNGTVLNTDAYNALEIAISALTDQKWIPVSERLPEKPNMYIVTDSKGDVVRFVFNDTESSRKYWLRCAKAWMPQPEPYRGEGD